MGNVLGRLRTPPGQTYTRVTFPEGFTIAQMSRRLESTVDRLTATDFVADAEDPTVSSPLKPSRRGDAGGAALPRHVSGVERRVGGAAHRSDAGAHGSVTDQEDITTKSAELGRTPYEILIIASMIEKEAKVDEDRAKISRVIHNRLSVTANNPDEPFRLQIDAAVLYGRTQLGLDTEMPFSELRQIPSAWNTYLLDGLPLGHRSRIPGGRRSAPRSIRHRTRRPAIRSARCSPRISVPTTATSSSTSSPTTTDGTRSRSRVHSTRRT